ncbi:unnamed protein product [Phytomonas sp. EM1]|nr:unnamed protein product [Phytomonas sp. EM1]|eukprot:CCW64760.1 unnamed protein product [Phytomonas sp. isolate EM1]
MDYYFSIIQNVFPSPFDHQLTPKRTSVRRGCRPHVVWVTCDPTMKIGTSVSLRGEDNGGATESSITNINGDSTEREEGCRDEKASTSLPTYDLARFLTVDSETGKKVAWYYPTSCDDDGGPTMDHKKKVGSSGCFLSSGIPSDRRIATMLPDAYDNSSLEKTEIPRMMPLLWVSDDLGNIYKLQHPALPSTAVGTSEVDGVDAFASSVSSGQKRSRPIDLDDPNERPLQRPRAEGFPLSSLPTTWELVVPSRSVLTSLAYPSDDGVEGPSVGALFGVSRGSPGWAGLAWAPSGPRLFSAREGFSDLRLVDPVARAVVRTYGTTHGPTGLFVPGGSSWSSHEAGSGGNSLLVDTVLITEGCLATLFDVRCPGVVMSLTAQLADATQHVRQSQGTTDASNGKNGANPKAGSASSPPLVASRLTSSAGTIRDVCGTANSFEVALCIDRALCVYDFRKFTRLWTSLNVLKYEIGSIASLGGGRAVACAGIDSEVRIVSLYPKHNLASDNTASSCLTLQAKKGKGDNAANIAEECEDEDSPKGTFRTRLDTTTACETTWQGGWVTSYNHAGAAAVGVSMTNELFLAQ